MDEMQSESICAPITLQLPRLAPFRMIIGTYLGHIHIRIFASGFGMLYTMRISSDANSKEAWKVDANIRFWGCVITKAAQPLVHLPLIHNGGFVPSSIVFHFRSSAIDLAI